MHSLMSDRKGILFAVPGTTCEQAMGAFSRIEAAAVRRFPGVRVRWAYTSGPIRRKLAARGIVVDDPVAALVAMQAEGLTRVGVVSLHMTDGMEYGELSEVVKGFGGQLGNRMRVALGYPLMTSEEDWGRVLSVVLAALPATPGAAERVILVAHGSTDPRAAETLKRAGQQARRVDPGLILGMMLGSPVRDEVVRDCLAAGVRKIWLVPCFVAAGLTVVQDIAGTGEHSWASALKRAGLEVVPIVRGLGETDGVVEVWLNQAERLLHDA